MYYTNGRMYDGSLCYSLDQFTDITPCYTTEQFKEAVMKSFKAGQIEGHGIDHIEPEQYYNETYGMDKR